MRKYMICTLALALLLVGRSQAQQSNWQNLEKIRPGDRVEVVNMRLATYAGEFVGFTDSDLTLRDAGNTAVIPRAEIYRIKVLGRGRGRHIGRGTLYGAVIGTGVGAVVAARGDYTSGERASVVVGGALWGVGIGALVGAVKTPHLDIYRSPVKPPKK